MTSSLRETARSAKQSFYTLLGTRVATAIRNATPIPADLSVPRPFSQCLTELSQCLTTLTQTVVDSEQARANEALVLTGAWLNPLEEAVEELAKTLESGSSAVFQTNFISAMQSALQGFPLARARMESANLTLQTLLHKVVSEQAAIVLKRCGVFEKAVVLRPWRERVNAAMAAIARAKATDDGTGVRPESIVIPLLCNEAGMDVNSMRQMGLSFTANVYHAQPLVLSLCDRIVYAPLRISARQAVVRLIVLYYKSLYDEAHSPEGGYKREELEDMFGVTPEAAATMLDLPPTMTSTASSSSSSS